jgi:hypothetical protein
VPALLRDDCALPGAVALHGLALALLVSRGIRSSWSMEPSSPSCWRSSARRPSPGPGGLAAFAAATGLGMAMSAGSWLPAWNYGAISVRNDAQAMAQAAESFSASTLDLAALAWPSAAGYGGTGYHGGLRATDFPNHVGLVVLGLAILGAFAGAAVRGRRAARVFGACTAFALLAALGTHLPLVDGVLRALPLLRAFRTPVTWLIPASLLLGMLAARGLSVLTAGRPGRRATAIAWALALAGVAEMAFVSLPILHRASGPASRLQPAPPDALALAAARDPLHRSYAFTPDRFFSNDWISWRAHSVSGLHGAVPSRWNDLRLSGVLLRGGFMRAIATRWLFDLPAGLVGSPGVRATAGGHESENTLPRAYAVRRVDVVPDEVTMLKAVGNPRFDAAGIAYALDGDAAGDFPGSRTAAIEWLRDEPDRQSLKVTATDRCFVVVADAWAPGWSARVDGRPVRLLLVDAALRGVTLPAGSHSLDLAYVPPGWNIGRLLAGLGWLAWIAVGVWAILASRSLATVRLPISGRG